MRRNDTNTFKAVNEIIHIPIMSNREFLETYAQAGRVGLIGGTTLIEKAIRRAERHVDTDKRWSLWSHAFLFQGKRRDGHHWVIESDLQIHHKHIKLGVQENRITEFFNEKTYPNLAVLDFELADAQVGVLLREGLEMVANRSIYSLHQLIGTLVALRHPQFRSQRNLLAREKSCYCSALVQHVFLKAEIDLAPGVHESHGTPEDISRTTVPHTTYLLQRTKPEKV